MSSNYMMTTPLITSDLIEYAELVYPSTAIISRENSDQIQQSSFGEVALHSRCLASALVAMGLGAGDRVGAIGWSTRRYLELFYGVPGMGAALHTINPRLHDTDLVYIINDAQDKVLCVDRFTSQSVEPIVSQLKSVERYIWLDDPAAIPEQHGFPDLISYDALLEQGNPAYRWPELDENSACTICYTSGTTGRPKGVIYTHRGNVLLTLSSSSKGFFGYPQSEGAAQSFLSLTGMFHANAWMMPFAAPLLGAKLILPGRDYTPGKLLELIEVGQATLAAGVPTILQSLVDYLQQENKSLGSLKKVVLAGARPARSLCDTLETEFHIDVGQAWGMTEGQMGAVPLHKQEYNDLSTAEKIDKKFRGGLINFGVKMRLIDDMEKDVPFDGKSPGHLVIKAPWVIDHYLNHTPQDRADYTTADGWFRTGDIACIHPDGCLEIVDRSKDLIKSGGEWICSAVIESLVNTAPEVVESAVIGVPHPKWQERPVLFVVRKPDSTIDEVLIRSHMKDRIASWWMPDTILFIDALPKSEVGKVNKKALREMYSDAGGVGS